MKDIVGLFTEPGPTPSRLRFCATCVGSRRYGATRPCPSPGPCTDCIFSPPPSFSTSTRRARMRNDGERDPSMLGVDMRNSNTTRKIFFNLTTSFYGLSESVLPRENRMLISVLSIKAVQSGSAGKSLPSQKTTDNNAAAYQTRIPKRDRSAVVNPCQHV
ncbi:hypothetical protein OG21DRAFT_19536 [Imleria badia]|nr:hypothetical protein OG21DRAFT_19536 [Imleria badia]